MRRAEPGPNPNYIRSISGIKPKRPGPKILIFTPLLGCFTPHHALSNLLQTFRQPTPILCVSTPGRTRHRGPLKGPRGPFNGPRGPLGSSILGQRRILLFWVPSAENFGDDPSRDVPLREAAVPTAEQTPWVRCEATASRHTTRGVGDPGSVAGEVSSGPGGVSQALRAASVQVLGGWDAGVVNGCPRPEFDLARAGPRAELFDLVRSGRVRYVHFRLPLVSWSPLRKFGSPRFVPPPLQRNRANLRP